MVDDASLYTDRLLKCIAEEGAECSHYAPVFPPATKPRQVMEPLGPHAIRVWSQNLFPFQIFRKAARDKPDIAHLQFEFYGIHSYGPLYSSLGVPLTLLFLQLLGVKTVVTVHVVLPRGHVLESVRDTSPASRRIPTIFLEAFLIFSYRIISHFSDTILVHANVFKKRLVEDYGVNPSKVKVIPHGVEPFEAVSDRHLDANMLDPDIILYFGVLSPRKGLENLLEAFALLTKRIGDCKLWLAGSSPPYYNGYDTDLKDLATKLELGSKVRFLGSVDNKLAHDLFKQAKFAVLPYSYDVSASGVLSWALAHGLPVIVSKTDYFNEELSQCRFGLSVPVGNPAFLADAMETLLARGDLRSYFSENARQGRLSRSWNSTARATLEVYQDLLS